MERQCYWFNPRPRLTIEYTGTKNISNCYNADYYRITTATFRLKPEQLTALRDAGLLGSGQEFRLKSQCDGKESPAGEDDVPCVELIDGVVQPGVAINEYSGKPYPNMKCPYFVYEIERRTDSGD